MAEVRQGINNFLDVACDPKFYQILDNLEGASIFLAFNDQTNAIFYLEKDEIVIIDLMNIFASNVISFQRNDGQIVLYCNRKKQSQSILTRFLKFLADKSFEADDTEEIEDWRTAAGHLFRDFADAQPFKSFIASVFERALSQIEEELKPN